MVSGSDQGKNRSMNPYFKPRTPEPRAGALGIILRSMLCALAVLIVGAGIWLGVDAIFNEVVPGERVGDGWNGSTNTNVVVHLPSTSHQSN